MADRTALDEKRERLRKLLLEKAQRPQQYPLTYGQQALWYLHQLAPDTSSYHILFTARIQSPVEHGAFQEAVSQLTARHPAMRTTITKEGEQLMQCVHHEMDIPVTLHDTAALSEEEVRRQVLAAANSPFSFADGPLFRFDLFARPTDTILLIAIHHILSDFWSLSILLDELGQLYQAALSSVPAALPPVKGTYAKHVRWQLDLLTGTEGQTLRDYWEQELSGDLPALSLPTDFRRPSTQSYQGSTYYFEIDPALVHQIDALARTERVTPYVTLLSAFQTFLHRYSGQDDILVGSPTAGRNRLEMEDVIGYFANPITLRASFNGSVTFRELLNTNKSKVLHGLAHQDYPFSLLVEQLKQERDPSRSPIFQAMFAFHKATHLKEQGLTRYISGDPQARLDLHGMQLSSYLIPQQEGQFDVTLSLTKDDHVLRGGFSYNTDLFAHETIERMAAHFQVLLRHLLQDPDGDVRQAPLLHEAERQKVLYEWNQPQTIHEMQPVHERLAVQAQRTPEAAAIVCGDQILRYGELMAKAQRTARRLQTLGLQPQERVGVLLARSLHLPVGLIGILQAGGVYVPLDPQYPEERLRYIVEDSGLTTILTTREDAPRIPVSSVRLVCLDELEDEACGEPIERTVSLHQPAYVIYTSGSTGRPKGVEIEHGPLISHLLTIKEYYQITSEDCVLQFSSYSFDTSIEQMLSALLSGATVVLRGPELWSPHDLLQQVHQHRISVMNLPTSYWNQLVQTWRELQVPLPQSLRLMIVGGEAMLPMHVQAWQELPTADIRLLNVYGPTETVVTSHAYEITADAAALAPDKAVPIGRTLGCRTSYVLDDFGNPVPLGVPGELHIGGISLARGYVNRPELTVQKFVADPFGTDTGSRLYKTGDLVRLRADGVLEFLGRLDNQVKIRGFRIETEEIEAVLLNHESVRESVVLVQEAPAGEKRLLAFCVPADSAEVTAHDLREFCQGRLAEYMVPSAFLLVDAIPLTANGKANRAALLALELPQEQRDAVAPRNDVEQALAAIWSQVLHQESMGVHDNFFERGGDSILALQVIMQAAKLNLRITPNQLFEHPTIAKLSAVADTTLYQGTHRKIPLTEEQYQLLTTVSRPARQKAFWLTGADWSIREIEDSLRALLHQHEALRLQMEPDSKVWVQPGPESSTSLPLQLIDLRKVPQQEQQLLMEQTFEQAIHAASGPMWQAVLFDRGDDQESMLCLIGDRLLVDDSMWALLIHEFQMALQQARTGMLKQETAKTAWPTWKPPATDSRSALMLFEKTAALGFSLSVLETQALLQSARRMYRATPETVLRTAVAQSLEIDTTLSENKHGQHPASETGVDVIFYGSLSSFNTSVLTSIRPHAHGTVTGTRVVIHGFLFQERLHILFQYSTEVVDLQAIQTLAARLETELQNLHDHCRQQTDPVLSVGDFPLANVKTEDYRWLSSRYEDIEDLYPLTPVQAGMVYHNLTSAQPDLYVAQFDCKLEGNLEASSFQTAWQTVVNRHSILRTAFVCTHLSEPLQVVAARVNVPWTELDWRDSTSAEREQRLERLIQAERNTPFDLETAPLMRVHLIRLTEDLYHLVLTNHHLLLDGWSLIQFLQEVLSAYDQLQVGGGVSLTTPRDYRDYIAWYQAQDWHQAEQFWRDLLQGCHTPTPLHLKPATHDQVSSFLEASYTLSATETRALQAAALQQNITLNTLLQGAWALLLRDRSGHTDVVFGAASSGRPSELAGADSIVGLFINTLPVRVQTRDGEKWADSLRILQDTQLQARRHEGTPLSLIHSWCGLVRGQALFESIVAFENLPVHSSQFKRRDLQLSDIRNTVRNHYPLCLKVTPGHELMLQLEEDGNRMTRQELETTLSHLRHLLLTMAERPEACWDDLHTALTSYQKAEKAQRQQALQNDKLAKLKSMLAKK
ncbi:amino acid adenylation domain-containing protein [Tumebacillus sp. DT12]|uniref:Amino acid adenylation domain-containing protein n=1 Tax=Tumebacillus lacus TaxID=2995335 RepID=A0ABT3WXK8_9BACL|nr:non-ribosomal peptide synthetase [Tumebacillus lacus]MCX7569417.1 amino acid adenylation domain-containing protein [Tumebacillus lacus]